MKENKSIMKDNNAVSLVTSALLLVAISVIIASSFYIWYEGVLSRSAESTETHTQHTLLYQYSELRISTYSEYYITRDSNNDNRIDAGPDFDERSIQEIRVDLINDGELELNDVELKVSMTGDDLTWYALDIRRDEDFALYNRSGMPYLLNGSRVFFKNTTASPTSMILITEYGEEYSASDEQGSLLNTTDWRIDRSELHQPTCNAGVISPSSRRSIYIYILLDDVPVGTHVLKIQARSAEGKRAEGSVILNVS